MSYWFGENPDNWNVIKVKNIFNMVNGGTPKSDVKEYWSDSEVVWVTPEDLSKDGKYLSDSNRKISYLGLENCSANFIKENSIVLSTRAPIGNVKVSTVPFTTNQGCKSLEANTKVSINYYYYVFHFAKEHLNTLGHGTTFLELSNYSLKNIFVPYPDLNVQNLIGNYLDMKCEQIDELIFAKKKQIRLLEQQRQSIITEVVTKGLNPNVKMKDSGVEWIGEIPEHWEKKRIKHLVKRMNRQVKPHHEVITAFRDGQVTLRKNRREDGFTFSVKEIGYQGINEGDLVVHQMDAFAGAIGVSDSEGKASPVYTVCTAKNENEIHLPYLCEVIRVMSKSGYIESLAKGIRERSTDFRWSDMGPLLSILPPKTEQIEIMEYIDNKSNNIKFLISNLRTNLEKLKEYRQSLIYEVVTGKIDVRDMELEQVR